MGDKNLAVRFPGSVSGLVPPKLVDQLIEAQKIPVESAKKRKANFTKEKSEVQKLQSMLNELDTSLNGLKSKADFYRLKVEFIMMDHDPEGIDEFFRFANQFKLPPR